MGKAASKFCSQCFKSDDSNLKVQEQELESPLLFSSSHRNKTMEIQQTYELTETKIPPHVDQEHLLRLVEKATHLFLNHLHSPLQEEGSNELVNKDGFMIYGKELQDSILIKGQ